ncbi:xyloglucan endotransglucosylase/hydrolase 13, partial [Genlisea aurea]
VLSLVGLVSGLRQNLPIVSFEEGYSHLFGENNLVVLRDGKSVRLSLDGRTGSGFVSQDVYRNGYFSASIKLPGDYTAGVVVAFYLSNGDRYEKNHDEIDIEFLGNVKGKEWRIQTNVYGNGSTGFGREERYGLWFDPTESFHHYSVLWTRNLIVFFVDDVPIREMKRMIIDGDGDEFPSKPMSVYGTIWDGSDWATNGGKYRVDYGYAPFVSEFSEFVLHGRSVGYAGERRAEMAEFRKGYMQYSYCYDRARYDSPLPECVIDAEEAERLRRFDPVTFGEVGGRRRRRRRGRRNR